MSAVVVPVAATLAALIVGGLLAVVVGSALEARSAGGPARAAWLVPWAESARLLRQRRRSGPGADRLLWRAGGAGLVLVPLLMLAVVPLGTVPVLDSPIGVVWFNVADVLVWVFVWLVGWGANSALALVGAFRFLASALAYELPLMFALTAPAVAAGSLRVVDVVNAQREVPNVVWMPVAFLVTLVGVVGFSAWGPLGPAVSTDLAGGVLAELSGPDRWLVEAGRHLLLVAGSVFAVTLFLGGGNGPYLPAWLWLALKSSAVTVLLVALRGRVVQLRPDRFMEIGWLVLLPAALVQLLVVALVVAGGGAA